MTFFAAVEVLTVFVAFAQTFDTMLNSKMSKGFDPLGKTSEASGDKMNGVLYHQYEQKVRPYIDLIDFLRSLGIDQDLPLPSIAVIGDQSSGKSSVLEALSGVSLPRGSGIITRCPLEMKMKKIREGKPWKGTLKYRDIEMHLHDPKFVEEEILKAQNIIAGTASGISTELISLKIESSQVPDLTLIDLPGIARVAVGDQPSDIGEQIKSLIQTFIEKAETIILVVVPSIVDIATTEALKMAKEFDPDGQRTLGILTKPDMIDKGNEEKTVAVVRNLVIELKKGYMIVKCRGQQDINENLSLAEAIENERVFFKHHPYFSPFLDEKKATVQFLAVKLTNELVEHIIESLPNLKRKIEDKLDETATELKTYGQPVPVADKETISFLVEKLRKYYDDISSIIKGEEKVEDQECKVFSHLREQFEGLKKHLDTSFTEFRGEHSNIEDFMKKNRGKELPGFISYSTFEKFITQQIENLEAPSFKLLNAVSELMYSAYTKTAKTHFERFPNLLQVIKSLIGDILEKEFRKAEKMLQSQFDMEKHIFSQDSIYSKILTKVNSMYAIHSDVNLMKAHLNTYLEITSDRLANQIPLIILHHIVNQYGTSLQTQVLELIQGDNNVNELLTENREIEEKRNFIIERIERLKKAKEQLNKFST
ncbi:interferon-induced GTP-binding protein Mx-like isoform X1 [Polypterus senegalus]|uniref:interferon-induced GTP-binding protein Mx-like isoform X1 n=2 Tax=Polypterus senegalus TaxID=55291 RepID=UPI001966BDE9|nr:interferon-induced GTP-binding protein Mx-like isoform X1 [Polypterus senegalus]